MRTESFLVLFLFLLAAVPVEAQNGELRCTGCVEMRFLDISPSPRQNAMGAVGTALPLKDAFGFYYNPAQLGFLGRTANAALHGYPGTVDWLGTDWSSTAVSLGYDFEAALGTPVGVGLGFMTTEMDYGMLDVVVADPASPTGYRRLEKAVRGPHREYDAFGIGGGIDAGVDVYVGITYKRPSSRPSPLALFPPGEQIQEPLPTPDPVQTSAVDVGMMAVLPLSDVLADILPLSDPIAPTGRASLGYAVTNIGGEVDMPPTPFPNPIPRTAQLGYSVSLGVDYRFDDALLRVATVDWSVEAQDLLVDDRDLSYQWPLGDINPFSNILLVRGSRNAERHWGVRGELVETVQFSYGSMDGGGADGQWTYGWGIHADGLMKGTAALLDNDRLAFLARHVDVQYYNAAYHAGVGGLRADFHGISLLIRGL